MTNDRATAEAHWANEWPNISESHRRLAVDLTVACLEGFPGSRIGERKALYTRIDPPLGRGRMELVAAIQPMADSVQLHFLLSPADAERAIATGLVADMRPGETRGKGGIWVKMSLPVDRAAAAKDLLRQSAAFQFAPSP